MSKKHNTLIAFILSVSLVLTSFAAVGFADPAYAAAKPQFSKKSVTLTAGNRTTLKMKNATRRVWWKSYNKKIVTVTKIRGKHRNIVTLRAKKAGTCYVRAKIGKKIYKCKVTVRKKQQTVKPTQPIKPEDEVEIEIKPLSSDLTDLSSSVKYQPESVAASDEFCAAATDFAVRLLKETIESEKEQGRNVLVSPDSVMTALAMTQNGAKGNTLSEMMNVLASADTTGISIEAYNKYLSGLHNRLGKTTKPIYTTANSIWSRRGEFDISKEFIRTNKKYHNASVYEAAFDQQTVADMNNWVYNNTRNMINGIIDRLDPLTRLVLINAVAFEGKWADPFEKYQVNEKGKFTNSSGKEQTVVMLNGSLQGKGTYLKVGTGKAFVKKYEGGTVAFVGILPPKGVSARTFAEGLSGEDFTAGWKNRQDKVVDIRIPEFSYDYDTKMKEILISMGMQEAFTDGADFSGMSENGYDEIKIDEVLHKTHIELDRNGTKAAAVTAVIAKASAYPSQEEPEKIYLDRPFVYALVDVTTGIPLFIGTVDTVK